MENAEGIKEHKLLKTIPTLTAIYQLFLHNCTYLIQPSEIRLFDY